MYINEVIDIVSPLSLDKKKESYESTTVRQLLNQNKFFPKQLIEFL